MVLFKLIDDEYLFEVQHRNRVELRTTENKTFEKGSRYYVNVRDKALQDKEDNQEKLKSIDVDKLVDKIQKDRTNTLNDQVSKALRAFRKEKAEERKVLKE